MSKEKANYKKFLIQELLYCAGCDTYGVYNHESCYKKFCCFCNHFFDTKDDLKNHVLHYHRKNWCETCHSVFKFFNKKEHEH